MNFFYSHALIKVAVLNAVSDKLLIANIYLLEKNVFIVPALSALITISTFTIHLMIIIMIVNILWFVKSQYIPADTRAVSKQYKPFKDSVTQ